TGGLQDDDELGQLTTRQIGERTQSQARIAIDESDVILFLVDGKAGLTAADLDVAETIRQSSKPVILGVNKTENEARRELAYEFYELALGDPIPFSSLHGIGTGDLLDEIVRRLPRADEVEEETE